MLLRNGDEVARNLAPFQRHKKAPYSYLSATMGSTLVARRAGK